MTDDQVHAHVTSVMEVIHRLRKQLKWETSKGTPVPIAAASALSSTTIMDGQEGLREL